MFKQYTVPIDRIVLGLRNISHYQFEVRIKILHHLEVQRSQFVISFKQTGEE